MELFAASRQWATRPADQRFWNLDDLYEATHGYYDTAAEAHCKLSKIETYPEGDEVRIRGNGELNARLTNWSFAQLSAFAGAPAGYLGTLPAEWASNLINHGLRQRPTNEEGTHKFLFHENGSLLCRAITSERYTRIWNHEVVNRLRDLQGQGWSVPPAWKVWGDHYDGPTRKATKNDVYPGGIVKVGDEIAPSGLYASDRDCFVFMVNEENRIDDGTEGGLGRGFFVSNSEVGDRSLRVTTFLYRYVCGNHIVWGAQEVEQLRIRHVGKADELWSPAISAELTQYAESSTSRELATIKAARKLELGKNKDEVLDTLFKRHIASRRTLSEAYATCEKHPEDGSPRTIWGMVQGLTRISQQTPFAAKRAQADEAAARLLALAV